ncbi:VOC family protein [Streptomyces sp. NPDC003077]|uniref:VOC family protein n=1 Tax=Streptomyces sp. NPDC003077 TaxID=3154443 RepID=UPI0033BD01B0
MPYRDAHAAVKQLTEAFGFTTAALFEGEDGSVPHAELTYGDGLAMLGSKGRGGAFDEAMGDECPVSVYVAVEGTDAHFERAEQAGAEILMAPIDEEHGSRDYLAGDVEGATCGPSARARPVVCRGEKGLRVSGFAEGPARFRFAGDLHVPAS